MRVLPTKIGPWPFLFFFSEGSIAKDIINNGPRSLKAIALTFDACKTKRPNVLDNSVINTLVKYHIPTTIFISGKWAKENRKEVRQLSLNPLFEVENHGFNHLHLTKINDYRLNHEILDNQKIIQEITGKRPTLFRPPYGEYNPKVLNLIKKLELKAIQFDIISGDANKLMTARKLTEKIIRKTNNGSIIIMHINKRGWNTAEALPYIIKGLELRGFKFMKVSELIATLKF